MIKLNKDQIKKIIQEINNKNKIKDIAKKYKISTVRIYQIKKEFNIKCENIYQIKKVGRKKISDKNYQEKEIELLKKENKKLQMENELIKKLQIYLERIKKQRSQIIKKIIKNNHNIAHKTIYSYFNISRQTFYRMLKTKPKKANYSKCNHQKSWFCDFLIEFNSTRVGKIYGYLRIFPALKAWILKEKNITLDFILTIRQMRKLMHDHKLKGQKRSNNKNQRKIKTKSDWEEAMNKVHNYHSTTKNNQIWSMDTKTIKTKEGYIYLFVILDFYSRMVISWSINSVKSFEKLISLALAKINFSQINSSDPIILHSDNAAEFHCEAMQEWAKNHNIILSRKKPMHLGGNALSENWFYHLTVEWLPKGNNYYENYKTAILDVKNYILFYNNERINSKFLLPPIEKFRK